MSNIAQNSYKAGQDPFSTHSEADYASASAEVEEARTFVTFELAGQWLAVDVVNVREILDRQSVTPLPKAPPGVEGVIDVRDHTVAVVDLSQKLSLPPSTDSEDMRFLVFEFKVGKGDVKTIAVRADKVLEVSQTQESEIEKPSEFSHEWNRNYVRGVMRNGERLVMIIKLETVFPSDELHSDGDIFKFD